MLRTPVEVAVAIEPSAKVTDILGWELEHVLRSSKVDASFRAM